MTEFLIRPAGRDDFESLRAVELAAFETLRAAGAVDGDPNASSDEDLERYLQDRLLYASTSPEGEIVGWCGGSEIARWLHIGEIDVHPDWQKKGIGRRLIHRLLREARARGLKGATLTTDRSAVFNAPFYLSIGFRIDQAQDAEPYLQKILEAEAAAGLDTGRRVAMTLLFEGATR
jgi:predicted N-acetyltransferase YhbS